MYRVSQEQMQSEQQSYKQNYNTFRPFHFQSESGDKIARHFASLLKTQNGMDVDDYAVEDNNKIESFLGHLPSHSKVLILGVGSGRETITAININLDAIGATLGSRNIDFGIQCLGIDPSRHLETLNEDLPFGSNHFDTVAGFQVFEHAIAPLIFLLEIGRVLKMGGELILEWPCAARYTMGSNPHHQICYDPGQAYALFQKAGFGDIKLCYADKSPIPEEKMWSGDHEKMLVISGRKQESDQEYIRQAWQ